MPGEVSAYSTLKSEPGPVGGRRRSRRARRGGMKGGEEKAPAPALGPAPAQLKVAGEEAAKVVGGVMEGGRRKRSTAKKIAGELKRVAKKAKKLTMKLMKMRHRK
uniref:Uncharacterized protein n=1 Tax=viral metagenome TaxID=1070528 RepID=A0A6C0K7P3_9ZZZZ